MRVTPKTEQEIAEENLWPAGVYDFEIIDGKDATSKSLNEMIVLDVRVFNDEGRQRMVTDYLLDSIAYKVRHAADACGLMDEYDAGILNGMDFIGKTGKLKLGIQKDKSGAYPDKNVINDYVKSENLVRGNVAASQSQSIPLDDEIPF